MRLVLIFFWGLIILSVSQPVNGQTTFGVIKGKILNKNDKEGIHVLNNTSGQYTITDEEGYWEIMAKENDTILFASIKYLPKTLIIDSKILKAETGFIDFFLENAVYELDEVQLSSTSLKIPYNLTEEEYATNNPEEIISVYRALGYGTKVDLEVLYKHISGYYSNLKKMRKWEKENQSAYRIFKMYNPTFLSEAYHIPESKAYDFLLFCIETTTIQQDFENRKYSLVLEHFKEKSSIYNERINGNN